jgi:hypothetical protein
MSACRLFFFFFSFFFRVCFLRAMGGDSGHFLKSGPGESTKDHSCQKPALTDGNLQVPADAI